MQGQCLWDEKKTKAERTCVQSGSREKLLEKSITFDARVTFFTCNSTGRRRSWPSSPGQQP